MARSDRPTPPRIAEPLEPIDLSDVVDGDLGECVLVTGHLRTAFDDALHVSAGRIENASLVGVSLVGSRFIDTVIQGCDFSGADLESAALTRVELRGCRLSGVRLSQGRMRDVRFIDCQLDTINLRHVQGEYVRFEQCRLVGAEFIGATLKGVAWWDCNLVDADVSQVSLERGQLHGSSLDGLKGASSLAPVAIDDDQAPVFAALLLAMLGVEVTARLDP
jgi:uncharacterized protein YjbI with pentapeptide repeats